MEVFNVIDLTKYIKIGNLTAEAHSSVKSTKHFPIYEINGKKMIYKPLSKTKPYTTPFFSYSEVYWSYIINKYFDYNAPRYYLAKNGDAEDKYYDKGVLVEDINKPGFELINLYDYFIKYPDEKVNIKDYVNYCMKTYDYTEILSSNLVAKNELIGKEIAYQILLSILRLDQNYHYENINFHENNSKLLVAQPIDFEFSTFFLYPDDINRYRRYKIAISSALNVKYGDDFQMAFQKLFMENDFDLVKTMTKNICIIIKMYPDVVKEFLNRLDKYIDEFNFKVFEDPDMYIGKLNSNSWEIGHAFFKDKDMNKYEVLRQEIKEVEIDKKKVFDRISNDILEHAKKLRLLLKIYMQARSVGIEDLEHLTIKNLLEVNKIYGDCDIIDVDLGTNSIKTIKRNASNR